MTMFRIECQPEFIKIGIPFITTQEITAVFQDGRPASFLLTPVAARLFDYRATLGNTKGYDFTDLTGHSMRIEMKSLTRNGIAFRASKNTGVGRTSSAQEVRDYHDNLDAFLVTDIAEFPIIDFYKFTGTRVARWHSDGRIRSRDAMITRPNFLALVREQFIVEIEHRTPPNDSPI